MNVNDLIRKSFNERASNYEQAAKIQKEIGSRMFARLDYLKINPRYILDLGSGTGYFSQLLKKRYPKAKIISCDIAFSMAKMVKKRQRLFNKWPVVNADMHKLPFAGAVFDLVFSNQVLHWTDNITALLQELNRVMAGNACLMFSSLGPDTFTEIKTAWNGIDNFDHHNTFMDLHDLGDYLLAKNFLDPVLDMEKIRVDFKDFQQLLSSLKEQGVKNINTNRPKGLMGRKAWQKFLENYQQLRINGKYPLSYEVVYAHAWKGTQSKNGNETRIPISSLLGSRR